MVREAPGGSRRVDAGGREAGPYSQLARVPYMRVWLLPVHQTYRCVFRGGFVPNNGGVGENGVEPSDACRRGRFS